MQLELLSRLPIFYQFASRCWYLCLQIPFPGILNGGWTNKFHWTRIPSTIRSGRFEIGLEQRLCWASNGELKISSNGSNKRACTLKNHALWASGTLQEREAITCESSGKLSANIDKPAAQSQNTPLEWWLSEINWELPMKDTRRLPLFSEELLTSDSPLGATNLKLD